MPYCIEQRISELEKEGSIAENVAVISIVLVLLAMKCYQHSLLQDTL
jgi:hypothetical protein